MNRALAEVPALPMLCRALFTPYKVLIVSPSVYGLFRIAISIGFYTLLDW